MKERLASLDGIARQMNGWLLALAIGLGMLDLTVLVAKCMPVLPDLPAAGADASEHPVGAGSAPHAPSRS